MKKRFKQDSEGRLVNPYTGEILDDRKGTLVYFPPKLRIEDFFMNFQKGLEELSKDKELWGQPRAVLDYMLSQMDFNNQIDLTQSEIAKALDISPNRVNEAIKKLVDKEILYKHPNRGRAFIYELSPKYAWKGKVVKLKEKLNDY